MNKNKILTIWDIDKTFYDGYAIIDFGKYLEKIGKFKQGFTEEIDNLQRRYKGNKISYEAFAKGVYKIYGKYIFDKNQYEILQLNKQFWQQAKKNLYPVSLKLHKYLASLGSHHAAISGSSFESLYYLLDSLGFVKMKSTEYETIDGNFTGKIVSKLVSHYDKSKLKLRVLNQKNKYDLVVGVGDNYADTSFLKHVDVPIIIGNRDEKLMGWAKRNNAIIFADLFSKQADVSELSNMIKNYRAK